jgi:hypothetical protein
MGRTHPCEVARCTGHHHTLLHVSSDCSVALALTQKQVVGARWLAKDGGSPWRRNLDSGKKEAKDSRDHNPQMGNWLWSLEGAEWSPV